MKENTEVFSERVTSYEDGFHVVSEEEENEVQNCETDLSIRESEMIFKNIFNPKD